MSPRCYCCEQPGTTREHVPPLCLFPEQKDVSLDVDHRTNLITVPSCPDHNLKKSGDDEYLLYILTMNLPAEELAGHHFSTKVMRAIERRPALIHRLLENVLPIIVRNTQSNEIFESGAVLIDAERIDRALRQVALGLYFHHVSKAWPGPMRVIPEFLMFLHEQNSIEWNTVLQHTSECADVLFKDVEFYGENPSVFKYQAVFPSEKMSAAFRMHFYGGAKVLAFFGVARS